jgi:hypothetical protein
MANKNKSKGSYHERKIAEWLNKIGIPAKRVPLSGSLGGEWSGDIHLTLDGRHLVAEVKYRDKSNFPSPFSVLDNRDIAIYKRRTGKPQTIVIMPDELFAQLLGEHNGKSSEDDSSSDGSGQKNNGD